MDSMTKQSKFWIVGAIVALVGLPTWLRTAQVTPTAVGDAKQEDAVALRIMFGMQRIHPKTWDGNIALDRGSLLRLTGVMFEHKDEIVGANGWKFTSRGTNYMDSRSPRGYDPVHTKPYELIPNGVVATVAAPNDARIDVKTVGGIFLSRSANSSSAIRSPFSKAKFPWNGCRPL